MKLPDHWDLNDEDIFKERIAINSGGSQLPFNELPREVIERSIWETNEMFSQRMLEKGE